MIIHYKILMHKAINKTKLLKAKSFSKSNKQKEITKKAISKKQLSLLTGFPYALHNMELYVVIYRNILHIPL